MSIISRDQYFYPKIAAVRREVKSKVAHRMADIFAGRGGVVIGVLARAAAISSLSDTANKIRPALERQGLTIVARRPSIAVCNVFGEPTSMHIWSIEALR